MRNQPTMNAYFVLTALTLLLLFWYYKITSLTIFRIIKEYRRQTKSVGKKITGTILEVSKKEKRRDTVAIPTQIKVEFPNFVGSLITENFKFLDSRPLSKRFEKGKSIKLMLDRYASGSKKVILHNGQIKINSFIVGIECALLLALAVGIYWLYNMIWQQAEGDWSRFVAQFNDAHLGMLIGIYTAVLLFLYFLFKGLGLAFVDKKSISYIKYNGFRTSARVDRFETTGTIINHQHQILFTFSFKDQQGHPRQAQDKKLVSPLEIGHLSQVNELSIIYVPQDPCGAKIFDNVNNGLDNFILQAVFYFVFFVFSCVVIGMFLASTLL